MKALSLVTLLLLSSSAFADGLLMPPAPPTPAPIPKTSEPAQPIPSSLKIEASGAMLDNIAVTALGVGIRNKRMVFNFAVYEATLLGSDPAAFIRNNQGTVALKSLTAMKAYGIHLKIQRDLSAEKIHDSFTAALDVNKISDSGAMKAFKHAVKTSGDVKKDDSIDIIVNSDKGVLTLVQGINIVAIKGDRAFCSDVMSIWLGTPADGGLKDLRETLIGAPKA